jgi:mono/diheme cytochrome c family protein
MRSKLTRRRFLAGAAAELDPYPRDFRNGVFKYTSTRGGVKPITMDLRRTLYRGVAGTAMPSFAQLPEEEIDALLEYVRYFSIRGQIELYLFQMVVDDDGTLPPDESQVMEEGVLPAAQSWLEPERRRAELVVKPPPRPPADTPERLAAVVAKGRELYLSTNSQCIKCHGPEGNGQGERSDLYDDWNKRKKGDTPGETAQLAALFTLPIERLRARSFHEGVFRGGSTPPDLYWRVCVGIKGTPMPAAGSAPGVPGVLSDEEIWWVVEFVRSLGGK